MFELSSNNIENREGLKKASVAILGAARSGIALARLLSKHCAAVLLSEAGNKAEISKKEDIRYALEKLVDSGVNLEFGGHSMQVLSTDLICLSPGVPLDIPILQQARRQSIPLLGETEVASWFCDAAMIAITGSNGKTTTTNLAGEIFRRYYRKVIVGGNIGTPLSALVKSQKDSEIAILELSSFQLQTIANLHPDIAVIMNLAPNHLDRHPSYEDYIAAKLNLVKNMDQDNILLYNADDPLLSERVAGVIPARLPFSTRQVLAEGAYWHNDVIHIQWGDLKRHIEIPDSKLPGPHNRYNMTVAATLAALKGIHDDDIRAVLRNFEGVEHRLETVDTLAGIRFINDSKATTPAALSYALQSFRAPIVLIAGGIDKGGDFAELNFFLKQQVRAAVVMGEAAAKMKKIWGEIVPVSRAQTMEQAVYKAFDLAREGDIVLLSPACSSFDMFDNYEARGHQFKAVVRRLKASQELPQNEENRDAGDE